MNSVKSIIFLKEFLSGRATLPFNYSLMPGDARISFQYQSPGETTSELVVIKDVPEYLELEFDDLGKELSVSKIKTLEGYFVDLANFKGYDDYLNRQISPKRRSNLRKYQRRLNHSLEVNYINYYGAIDREEYSRLFKMLRVFLIRRFDEKKEVNYELPHLEEMEEMVYDLVLDKKANIYVIYHGKKPISIRINMFYKELAFYIISGYDIDYSAFHIGAIDMLKNIEWCFQNRFTRYDLLKGYADYKKNWITHRYYNYNHLIYRPGSILQRSKKTLLFVKLQLRYGILEGSRKLGLYKGLKKLKKSLYSIRFGTNTIKYQWTSAATDQKPVHKIRVFEDPVYSALQRPVCDYLFRHKEQFKEIGVFTLESDSGRFLVKGKNSSSILIINK